MKRLLALMLTLMVLVLPAAGLAVTPDEFMNAHGGETRITEVTFDAANSPLFADNRSLATLLNGLSLSGVVSGSTMVGAASFQGSMIGTLGLTVQDGSSYLFSNLTDGRPISLAKADLERLLTYIGKLTGADFSQFTGMLNGGMPDIGSAAAAIDPAAFAGILQAVQQSATVESVNEGGDLHDLATQKLTLTVTSAQIADIIAEFLKALQSQPAFAASMQQNGTSLDSAIASVQQNLPQAYNDAVFVIYLDDAQAPVYITMTMPAKDKTAPDISAVYFRKTENGNPTYGAQLRAHNDTGDLKVSVAVPSITAELKNVEIRAHAESNGKTVLDATASYSAVVTETADSYTGETLLDINYVQENQKLSGQLTVTRKLDSTAAAPLTTDIGLKISGVDVLGIHATTAFSSQPVSVDVSNAVHAASMTDDELQSWLVTLITTVQTKLTENTGTLPAGLFK